MLAPWSSDNTTVNGITLGWIVGVAVKLRMPSSEICGRTRKASASEGLFSVTSNFQSLRRLVGGSGIYPGGPLLREGEGLHRRQLEITAGGELRGVVHGAHGDRHGGSRRIGAAVVGAIAELVGAVEIGIRRVGEGPVRVEREAPVRRRPADDLGRERVAFASVSLARTPGAAWFSVPSSPTLNPSGLATGATFEAVTSYVSASEALAANPPPPR